jgi:hypothetical protein
MSAPPGLPELPSWEVSSPPGPGAPARLPTPRARPRSAPPRRDSSTDPTVLVLPLASFESSCGSRPSRQPRPPDSAPEKAIPSIRLFGMSMRSSWNRSAARAPSPAGYLLSNPVRSSSFLYSLYINRLVHTGGHLVRQRRYGQSTDRIARRLRNDLCQPCEARRDGCSVWRRACRLASTRPPGWVSAPRRSRRCRHWARSSSKEIRP